MPIIRVIDFETSGMEPPHAEVCEYGYQDITLCADGVWALGDTGTSLYRVAKMPPEVRAVHHITMADLAPFGPFDPERLWLHAQEEGVSIVAAHNLDFEAKFWGEAKLPMLCTYKAALRTWPDAPSHSNGALRYWLEDQGRLSLEHERAMPPHRAQPDAYVTAHILMALLKTETAGQMVKWTKEPRVLPTCPIGKFRGKPWAEVEGGFLNWMLGQPTMEADLKWNAQREIDRRRDVL